MSIHDAALVAVEEVVRRGDHLDAALEVLRPFARLGAEMRRRGAAHWPASWPLLIGSDFVEGLNGRLAMRLHSAHCLAALEFWQSHRQEEP